MAESAVGRIAHGDFLMMAVIVDRNMTQKTVECMSGAGLHSTFTMPGRGTAGSEILNVLGLGDSKKDVILSTVREGSVKTIFETLIAERKLDEPGRGIAFTVPLSGVLYGRGLFEASSGERAEGEQDMSEKYEYDLILAVTNSGFADLVLEAARSVHPGGGTVVHGRETGMKGGEKFFGVSIQPEKEIVIILTRSENRTGIMEAIMKKAGPDSKANTFAVTLPVRDTAGLSAELKG